MTQPSPFLSSEHHAPVPLWRDIRVLRWLFQIGVLLGVIALVFVLVQNLQENLSRLGLRFGFDFLDARAGIQIGEGPAFDPNDSFFAAYLVGVVNTIRVAVLGVVLATIVGTLAGVARLSGNWLVRSIAWVYVEVMQNTPLLVQLFFWYVLIRSLPAQDVDTVGRIPAQPITLGPIEIPTLVYFSQRAAALPGLELTSSFSFWWPYLIGGLAAAVAAWYARNRLSERQERPPTGQFSWASMAFLLVAGVGWLLAPSIPVKVIIPTLSSQGIVANYIGGWELSNSFQALLIWLVLYTSAFIAEAVRAGIQAVSYGQIEAAISLGLTPVQRLRLIILPQAMRVIIPPLINQYLNLIKNSSLAIAVGYPDLYNISQTIGNQSGQNIQVIIMIMATYLSMSLVVSVIMNAVNQRLQIKER